MAVRQYGLEQNAAAERALADASRTLMVAVDKHFVGFADVEGRARQHLAVDGDAALGDPGFRVAARYDDGIFCAEAIGT